jgi:hypothetical protein
MVRIIPSAKAKAEVRSAMRTLGANCTLDELKELTGYQPALIRQIIKESKTKPKKTGVVSKTPEERDAPVFIKEIQKNTGLECVKLVTIRGMDEWMLLAPTGVPLLRLIGKGDLIQFARAGKEPSKVLQGLKTSTIEGRRQARKRKRKND